MHGLAAEVTDPDELTKLRRGPLQSWGRKDVDEADHWIRIPVEEISGRRIEEQY